MLFCTVASSIVIETHIQTNKLIRGVAESQSTPATNTNTVTLLFFSLKKKTTTPTYQ